MRHIYDYLRFKNVGYFFGLFAFLLTIAQGVLYMYVPENIFNIQVVFLCLVGAGLFHLFSLFPKTAVLGPVSLMVCDFLCICAFASADGNFNILSTAFFSGFSFEAFFSLEVPVYLSILFFIISFILSSIAMYLPQTRKTLGEKRFDRLVGNLNRGGKAR